LECLCGHLLGTSKSWNSAALSEREQKNAHRLRKLRLEADRATQIGSAHHHAEELRLCSSFRHDSLNSRNGSIAGEFNIPRNSRSVLFGAKYVSTIILTTSSAFSTMSTLDCTRILLIRAYTFTKADTPASLGASASAYSLDASSINYL
jgi:hypothetical protein